MYDHSMKWPDEKKILKIQINQIQDHKYDMDACRETFY